MSQKNLRQNASSPQQIPPENREHYLKEELYFLVCNDPLIFYFLQNRPLCSIWYWDLEDPEHEWMSPRFWEVFGYPPEDKLHLDNAW